MRLERVSRRDESARDVRREPRIEQTQRGAPAWANRRAAVQPAMLAPTTATSKRSANGRQDEDRHDHAHDCERGHGGILGAPRRPPRGRAPSSRWLVAAFYPLDPGLAGGKLLIRLGEVSRRLAFLDWVVCRVVSLALLTLLSPRGVQPAQRRVVSFSVLAWVFGVFGETHGSSCLRPLCSRVQGKGSPSTIDRSRLARWSDLDTRAESALLPQPPRLRGPLAGRRRFGCA